MTKKDFSFNYNIKTKTGKIKIDDKYIDLNTNEVELKNTTPFFSGSFFSSSSGIGGYGLNLLRRKK